MTAKHIWLYSILLAGMLIACQRAPQPKPRGYFRIDIPDTAYVDMATLPGYAAYPYRFALSKNAELRQPTSEDREPYWTDIHYPGLNMDIHCSYKPVEGNLRELLDDANRFVYDHTIMSSSIPVDTYTDDEKHVYGLLFHLEGNTASPYQFILTDSTTHFFRGAVYCNCIPNIDSLAPVYDYMQIDVHRLMESFSWR